MNFGIYCHTNFVEFWNVAFETCCPKQCELFLYKYFWRYMVHRPGRNKIWLNGENFVPCSPILFLPSRKSSSFVPTRPRKAQVLFWKTHILFRLGTEKTQVLTYKRAFLTYGGSFRMEKDDKPSNYDPI